jgi:creatinine amidohydrolase
MISDGTNARQWSAATWEELRDLDRGRVVAILPIGALEAHGPHLPLATDVVIAEAMARRGSEMLAARGVETVVLPALAYTVAGFAAGFPGTISIRPTTSMALIADIADVLARQGFGALVLANAHLDPVHLEALREAAEGAPLPALVIDLTRRPWGARLGEEFRSGACHAGQFEGSVVLAERRDWVRREIAGALPALAISLSAAIRKGQRSFEEAGLERAYCGDPAAATADEGRETIEVLGAILADAVIEAGLPPPSGP